MANIATTYEVRWGDEAVELEREKPAKDKARRESLKEGAGEVAVIHFQRGEAAGGWVYKAGQQTRRLDATEAQAMAASQDAATGEGGEDTRETEEEAPGPRQGAQGGVPSTASLHEEFKSREGTYKAKLLDRLGASFGNPVTIGSLILAVYGVKRTGDHAGPLREVMKGLHAAIANGSLPYKITRSREDGQVCFTLERNR